MLEGSHETNHRVVVAVLAGADGDVGAAVESVLGHGLSAFLFDTTEDGRHLVHSSEVIRVVRLSWTNSFADARNRGMDLIEQEAASFRHVLWLDSDEVLESVADRWDESLDPGHVGTPQIYDSVLETHDVGRIVPLASGIRFHGLVHEYLVAADARPMPYAPVSIRIRHEGYEGRDRSRRNSALLLKQIEEDDGNCRWRPFLLRDGGALLTEGQICELTQQQMKLSPPEGPVGGIAAADYEGMTFRSAALALLKRNKAAKADELLSRCTASARSSESELLYLKVMVQAVANAIDTSLFQDIVRFRTSDLSQPSDADMPWLDAAIAHVLELMGDQDAADDYRQQSTPYTDEFFISSKIR